MSGLVDFLKTVEFMVDFPNELLERIARDLESVGYPAGVEIFPDEAIGDDMFFIVKGEVQLKKRGQILLTRKAGEFFGEMALIDDAPRSAAAAAGSDVALLRWQREAFHECLKENGQVAYSICRALSAKMRQDVESATRFKQDLERAAQVQRAILPGGDLRNSAIDLAVFCQQADGVGGDYYDYIDFEGGENAVMVADAQGHGFSAALLVAMLKARLSGVIVRERAPEEVVGALNQTISDDIATDIRTASCFFVLLDGTRRTFRYCGAGHIPQYLLRLSSGEVEKLASQNLVMGFAGRDSVRFESSSRKWDSGDLLVLCTDGVTEMKNSSEEEFGPERLSEFIARYGDLAPDEIRGKLHEHLEAFRGGGPLEDDVTFLIARLL